MASTRTKWPKELTRFVYEAVLENSKYRKFTLQSISQTIIQKHQIILSGAFAEITADSFHRRRTSHEALQDAVAFRLNILEKRHVIQRASKNYREWKLVPNAK